MPAFVVAAHTLYTYFLYVCLLLKDKQVVLFLGCCTEPENSIQTLIFHLFSYVLKNGPNS